MNEHDDLIQRVTDTLKEPVEMNPRLDARVMTEIATLAPTARGGSRVHRAVSWLTHTQTIRLNPIGGLAMAVAVVALIFVGSRIVAPRATGPSAASAAVVTTIQFVLVAPEAGSVAVVGDFNDWDVSATMLSQDQTPGVWSVTVPLEPGRYRYSFLVDGTKWLTDPRAALAVADEFGRPNSVLTIGEL